MPAFRPAVERFWEKVNKDGPVAVESLGQCWLWMGWKSERGYGRIYDGVRDVQAHRFSYELQVGPIPEGLTLDHLCRNRPCVRPSHLEPVTIQENTLRGFGLAALNARKTACKHGHEFTPHNTFRHYSNPRGRQCRACKQASNDRYYAKENVHAILTLASATRKESK